MSVMPSSMPARSAATSRAALARALAHASTCRGRARARACRPARATVGKSRGTAIMRGYRHEQLPCDSPVESAFATIRCHAARLRPQPPARTSCAAPARTIVPTPARCSSRSRTAARSRSAARPIIRRPRGALCTKVARYLERTYSDRARAASDAARRPQGRRPLRAHLLGRGARHDRRRASARSPRRRTARRRSCPTATPARWGCCNTARWTAASSIGSARRCSTARSARPPARRAGPRRSARRSGIDVEQFENSRLILIWGSNPVTSNLHFWTRAQEAKRRGAQADRHRSLSQRRPPRSATSTSRCMPGTDAALALGLMHVLIAEDLRRSRLHRPLHARLRRAARRAPPNGRRSASRSICGIARRAGRSRSRATTARSSPR